jgi:peptide/nickel transport system permease protein
VLRNAVIPAVTVLAINIGFLIGATVIIEQIFAVPGIGQLMINSIFQRDFPVVQGVTLVFGVMVVLVNLLADLSYAALDPRVRFDR